MRHANSNHCCHPTSVQPSMHLKNPNLTPHLSSSLSPWQQSIKGQPCIATAKLRALNNTKLKSQVCTPLWVKRLLAITSLLLMVPGPLTVANGCIFPYLSFPNEARRLCCINHQYPFITSSLAKLLT